MFSYKIVYIIKPPFVKHIMLLLPCGNVIHNAPKKGIVKEPFEVARGSRKAHLHKTISTHMSAWDLEMYAGQLSGMRGYDYNDYNCEHFLAELLGKPIKSEQKALLLFTGLSILAVLMMARRA